VDDLEGDQLVIGRCATGDEEEGGIAAIDDFRVWQSCRDQQAVGGVRGRGEEATFVFKEIAHPRPAGEHKLSHIFDNLGLLLGRQSGKPLGETL
jgi:hypothetical protein